MKQHTLDYKEQIKELGRQQNVQINYTLDGVTQTLGVEEINSVTPHYKANLLKSVMKQLDIDSNIDIPKNTPITFRHGILVNGVFEYLNFGNYIVYSSEKQEDTNSYKIVCYDKMIYSMKDYESLGLNYPTSIKTYLINLCQRLGYTLATTTFANMNRQLPRDVFEGIEYTYRDVLDDIAEATGSTIYINNSGGLVLGQIVDTNDTIDEEYLKDVNVKFGKKYGPINSLVLSRSESDNVYIQNEASVQQNGLCEIKIKDNQIMNDNNRSDYLEEIFNNIQGIEYYLNDFSSTGICYYDLLDRYNVKIGDNIYSCIMLNDEINITQGLEEQIYTEEPEVSETDYTKADKTDRKINQTILMVDKQNQTILALVTSNTELVSKTSQLLIDVEQLKSQIEEVADVTTTEDGYGRITIDNVNESEPVLLKVRPSGEDIIPLRPRVGLHPRVGLRPYTREIIFKRINESQGEQHHEVIYIIPKNLYKLGDVYDEFVLDYTNQQCYITHKIGINQNGDKYVLEIPSTEYLEYPTINLLVGDYEIYMPAFETAYIYAKLMAKNLYTDQFATKVELNSAITQTVESIDLGVNKKLTNYSTTQEMNSAINLKADSITSTVSETYSTKEETNTAKENAINTSDNNTDNKLRNYSTTSQMNSAITQKASEITSTVSANYITKSDSATNINTAKNEAINSANSSTDNKLRNYSTTTQMNSAIQQKADSITSSVSTTYITKSDSATNINNAKNQAISSANSSTDNKLKGYSTKTDTTNAKNEAIASANSSTDTKLLSYSTTQQMNTAINQKADSITSTVNSNITTAKQEAITSANSNTTNLLKSYSTTTQMNSAIDQKANQITSTVAETYTTKTETTEAINGIQVGATNLIRGSKDFKIDNNRITGWKNTNSWTFEKDSEGFTVATKSVGGATSNNIKSLYSNKCSIQKGDEIVISCWIKVDNATEWDVKTPYIFEVYNSSGTRVQYQDVSITLSNTNKPSVTSGKWFYFYSKHTVTSDDASSVSARLTLFRNGNIYIKKVKLELGNTASAWSPAPEDLESYTDTQITEAKTEIKQTTDSITSTVSSKVGYDEIASTISQTADRIFLSSNNFGWESNYSKMSTDGKLTVVQGNFQITNLSGTKLIDCSGSGMRYYNYQGNEIGALVSTYSTENNGELFLTLHKGDALNISKTSSDGKLFYSLMSFSDINEVPYIRNTVNGTLFSLAGGGITVENGLITGWSMNFTNFELSNVTITGIKVVDGLVAGVTYYQN